MTRNVVIASATRTPMGGFQGCFKDLTAVQLGATAIQGAIGQSGLSADDVGEVIMGCVLSAGLRQGPARQAAIAAGIPVSAGATTVNKLCGSGMKATMLAHDLIKAGSCDILVAGGMESMTNAPYLLAKGRAGYRMGHGTLQDSMFTDGLEDAETGRSMGSFAQEVADQYQITREEMDAYAVRSLQRAQSAIASGALTAETTPVEVRNRQGSVTVTDDEQPGNANIAKIPTLRPAFKENGTITAANSSSISDGASALVLLGEDTAQARGVTPIARIIGHATHSRHPSEFTLAPIGAIDRLLNQVGWGRDEVELYEINEAFAMVTMLAIRELNLDHERVNVHGGACAQGHPIGSTGSRIIVSLVHALRQQGKHKGVAALCIGGGEATAVAVEIL